MNSAQIFVLLVLVVLRDDISRLARVLAERIRGTQVTTGYRLGVALEYRVKQLLERDGYYVVRAAASKGLVDLAAMKPGQLLLVQCKRSGALPPAEWNELYDLAGHLGAVPVMAVKGPRGTLLYRLAARKDGTRRRQPMEPFSTDEPAGAP